MTEHDNIVIHGAMALYSESCRTIAPSMPPKWEARPFDELPERERTYWLRSSRCFFEAIREPTWDMIKGAVLERFGLGTAGELVATEWRCMIDKALLSAPEGAVPSEVRA